MRIVVLGGTGLIGQRIVRRLERLAQAVVVASPSTGVDSVTGVGLDSALESADAVIDVIHPSNLRSIDPGAFFAESSAHVAEAELRAGVAHHVALSVVGADTVSDGYFAAKAVQEQIVRNADVPYTIVRTTQFYEFARVIAKWNTTEDTVRLPARDVQPVASDDVADALAKLVMSGPRAATLELAGPHRMTLPDFVRRVLLSDRDDRYVVEDSTAQPTGFDIEGPYLVPDAPDITASTTLDDWLRRNPAR